MGKPTNLLFMSTNIYQENPEFILGNEMGGGFISFQEDHDGKITEDEYNESRLKWFTEADKNNDQKIELGK